MPGWASILGARRDQGARGPAGRGGVHGLVRLLAGRSSDEAKARAAQELGRACRADEDAAAQAAASGALPALVGLALDGATAEALQQAESALVSICGSLRREQQQLAAAAAGAIPVLVRLLGRPGAAAQMRQQAAAALGRMCSRNPANKEAAAAAGALATLARLLSPAHPAGAAGDSGAAPAEAHGAASGEQEEEEEEEEEAGAQREACYLLAVLCSSSERLVQQAAEAGCVPALVGLLGGGAAAEVQQQAAFALGHLCCSHAGSQQQAAAAGAVPALAQLLRPDAAEALQREAARALGDVCKGNAGNQKLAADAGAIPRLVQLLGRGGQGQELQRSAAWALGVICRGSGGNQRQAADAGAIPALTQLLASSRGPEVQQEAAWALSDLCSGCQPNQQTAAAAGALAALAELRGSSTPGVQQAANVAYCSLLMDRRCAADGDGTNGTCAPALDLGVKVELHTGKSTIGAIQAWSPGRAPAKARGAVQEPPAFLLCPISGQLFQEPVVAADGWTYERAMIERWLFGCRRCTSPMTNARLPSALLVPNLTVKSAAREWAEAHRWGVSKS
jgi:hypothetical protein